MRRKVIKRRVDEGEARRYEKARHMMKKEGYQNYMTWEKEEKDGRRES